LAVKLAKIGAVPSKKPDRCRTAGLLSASWGELIAGGLCLRASPAAIQPAMKKGVPGRRSAIATRCRLRSALLSFGRPRHSLNARRLDPLL
jgi:hypothetical protein